MLRKGLAECVAEKLALLLAAARQLQPPPEDAVKQRLPGEAIRICNEEMA